MKSFLSILIILLLKVVCLNATDFPDIKGWQPEGEILTYNPENLYEYINGAADQFLDYGFQILQSQDFSKGDLKITIDIYDMGESINAFGMYKTERPRDQEGEPIATEGIVAPPYQALLLKDRYYVKVNAFDGELSDSTGRSVLEAIANALPGTTGFPDVLQMLPQQGMIPGSEGYTKIGYLGLTELKNCIHANYKDQNGNEFQYFVVLPRDEKPIEKIWQSFSEKWTLVEKASHPTYRKKIPYKGINGMMLLEEKIIGVTDAFDEAQLLERLQLVVK
ncbi:hypothetical protein L0Z72_06435 [candidate division KSB1 bacterium]|nr:hypothetical protein [candidate division KSB1 bacterium]